MVWNGHGADTEIVNVSARQAMLNRWTETDKRWNKKLVSRGSVVAYLFIYLLIYLFIYYTV